MESAVSLARRSHDAFVVLARGAHVSVMGRTPRCSIDENNSAGVFRLHKVIGFADDHVPLKMTELGDGQRVRA